MLSYTVIIGFVEAHNIGWQLTLSFNMMTSSNGNIFRVTGPLCGEFTGDRWNPLTKASDTELWCFIWSVPKQTVERLMIWDAMALIMMWE